MNYVRILYIYIVEDFMYSGYLLLTLLLPCLIYQGLMEIKAKQNSRRVPAKYYFGVYVMLVYLWMVFKVTGIGLLADIVRLKDAISGGYNWNPLAGLDKGFVLNIIMFLPLGLLIPCIWKKCRSITNVTVTGFLLSLTIEISQMFNARATDIDDLIANTSGACLGYVIWFITRKIAGQNCGEKYKMAERKWEPAIYVALAFLGTFFLYDPYAI